MAVKNEVVQVLRYPTPVVGDMMFYERVDSVLPKNRTYTLGQPHPNCEKYPNHKLCYVEPAGAMEDNLQLWHYIIDRDRQDEFNWEHSTCSIGGRKFDAVVRTYVTLRTAYSPTTPALGSAMPALGEVSPEGSSSSTVNALGVAVALFGSGYVLAEREETRTEMHQIDNLYVIEKRVYVKRSVISSLGYDSQFGKVLPTSVTLYHKDEIVSGGLSMSALAALPNNAYWGLQTNGIVVTWEQLSTEWYAVTSQTVVGGTFVDGVVAVHSYTSNDNYYWPPVLDSIEFMDWDRRDGGVDIYPRVNYAQEGYRGPCLTTTTVTWSKTPFTITKADQMLPTSIHYASPFFSLNVPECLHGAVDAQCDIGTTDPQYRQNVGSTRTTAATNYVDWDAANPLTAYDGQTPFRGGFLRTVKVVQKPA